MLGIVILIVELWQKLWEKVWWAIANILGSTLGTWEHAKNALKALGVHTFGTWCEHIWLTTWCAPGEKTLKTSKSKNVQNSHSFPKGKKYDS
jgi:hypothetical protein